MSIKSSIPMGSFIGRLSSRKGPKITTSMSDGPGSNSGSFSSAEQKQLDGIKSSLEKLLLIEKDQYDKLGDRILKTARQSERQRLTSKENKAEARKPKSKEDAKKNPVVKGALKGLDGLIGFFGNLLKWFVGYKIVEWVSKPENLKKVQNFSKLFLGIIKFVSTVVGFGVDKLLSGIDKVINGDGVSRLFGFLEAAVGFFALKWLANPLKIITDIKKIAGLFTKTIPNTINGIINFFTNLIPNAATGAIDSAVKEGFKGADAWAKNFPKEAAAQASKQAASQATEQAAKTGGKAASKVASSVAQKGTAKVTGKTLLKKLPVIGAVTSGIFAVDRARKGDWLGAGLELASGGASLIPGLGTAASLGIDAALIGRDIYNENNKNEIPKLAKGGIVTKPTKALIGEAGPEAILPLDKLSSFTDKGFSADVNKVIPDFMKLLTHPFKIIGAGIIAMTSMIPGIGPLVLPLVSSIASMFGVPQSIVQAFNKTKGFATSKLEDTGKSIAKLFGERPPKVSKSRGNSFTPSGDNSVRGLLGNILSALISKNSDNTTPPAPPAPPGPGGGSNPPAPSGGTPPSIGGSSKPLPENAKLAKAGDQQVQNLAGTQKDLLLKGYRYIPNTANRFWQDQNGRLYEATTIRNNTSLATMMGFGDEVYKLRAVTAEQIDKGFTSVGNSKAVASGMHERDKSIFRIINEGGILKKEIVNTIRQMQNSKGEWVDKMNSGGKVSGYGTGDKIPALLEPQEYVLNKNAVKGLGGTKELDKINFGMFPRFQNGSKTTQENILRYMTGGTVIEYITGDKNHPAYRRDHGGGNYHDHLAFKSKAERDRAIDYLQKKGWYVGSKNDGRHAPGSYHYKDLAFDIPFYPNQSRKGVTDDATGESKLSSALRKDLKAAGFVFGGPDKPEMDSPSTSPQTETDIIDFGNIAKMLGQLYSGLTGSKVPEALPSVSESSTPSRTIPTPSPNRSPQALNSAQKKNNTIVSSVYSQQSAGGNVINLSDPNKVITQTSNQPIIPTLGNTLPDTHLTLFPLTP